MKWWRSAFVVTGLASSASATTIFFTNKCSTNQDLYDNKDTTPIAPGATVTKTVPNAGFTGMFRSGKGARATLAEFATDGKTFWMDISIIPPGPGWCKSHEECVRVSGGTGFNIPMQIAPRSNANGKNCRTLTCLNDGCPEAYLFPTDDKKAMADCPVTTDIDVIFCPAGAAPPAQTPAPTPAPTPAQTPAPTTTKPPQTPAPTTTPPPTTKPPTTPPPATTPPPTTTPPPATTAPPTTTPPPATTTPPPSTESVAPSSSPSADAGTSANATQAVSNEDKNMNNETTAPPTTEASTTATPVSDAPVEATTQKSGGGGGGVSTYLLMALAATGAVVVAVIAITRRKQAQLRELEQKSPIAMIGSHTNLSTARGY